MNDVPGLATEALSLDQMVEKLKTLIPGLLAENGVPASGDILFKLVSEIEVVSHKLKGLVPKPAKPVSMRAMKRAAARGGSRR